MSISNFFKSVAYVFGWLIMQKKHMVAHSSKYDLRIKFLTPDGGGRTIYKTGLYEEYLTNFIYHRLKCTHGDLLFDVGANIGWYSNFLGKHFPMASVHSFEPDPANFHLLTWNLAKNGVSNVTPNNIGVGERTETKKLYLYKNSNIGRHSMLDINSGEYIEVETVALDEYIAKNKLDVKKIKFLKIDIEGFEYFAFKGADNLLSHLPVLLAEFTPAYMRKGGVEPSDLLKLLRAKDYEPFMINGLELLPVEDDELLSSGKNIDLLWVKKGYTIAD